MDTVHTMLSQITDLIHGIVYAGLAHILLVVTISGDDICQRFRDGRTGERYGGAKLFCGGNWHDTGMDRDVDSHRTDFIKETVEKGVIKEHLGDQGSNAGFYFFFQMPEVFFQAWRLEMFLRITGAGNLQIRVLLQVTDQIRGIMKFTIIELLVAHG